MRKNKKRAAHNFEARLQRSFIRIMPELPELIRKLEVQAKKFDGSEPKTFIRTMENDINRFGEKLKAREKRIYRLFMFVLRRLALRFWAKKFTLDVMGLTEQLASTDPRHLDLLRLMAEIDQRIPLASIVVSQYYSDPRVFFDARSLALHALNRAREASGETKAYLALDAFAKIFELVYKPYINILWVLSYFRLGKLPPSDPPAPGEMFRVARERLRDYPELLEPDAMWIRNSAVHDQPDPDLDENLLRLRDAKGKTAEMPVEDLLARAESMYLISAHTIPLVGQLYLYRQIFLKPEVLEMVTECMSFELAGDKEKLSDAEERARAYGDSLTEPLRTFLEQH